MAAQEQECYQVAEEIMEDENCANTLVVKATNRKSSKAKNDQQIIKFMSG